MQFKSKASFKDLLPLLKPYYRKLFLGGLCIFTYVICWPLLAWLAGELIPAIGEGNLLKVIDVIAKALLIFLIQKIAQFGQDTLLADPALRISQKLRTNLFSRLQNIEIEALESLSSGDITYRLTEDADRVGEVIYKTIQDTTPSVLQLITVFTYMLFLDWTLSLMTLLLVPIIGFLVAKFGERVIKAAEKSQKQVSELAGLLNEGIQGLPLVRAFAAEEWMQNRFDDEVILHRKARYKTLKLLALQHPVVGFIEASGILTVLAFGAARIQSGGINSQEFSSYIAALLMLIDPISHLTTNFNEFKQGQASLERLLEIELEPIENKDIANPIKIENIKGEIIFKNVSFGYNPNKKVLKDFNLKIPSGKIIALVGPSGAGKSTIFSLLLRFKSPDTGSIYLDDVNLSQLKVNKIRNKFAIVTQRTYIFSGTIKDAIRFGRKYDKQSIIEASKIANAHDFIMKMPKGYDTKLEERATNISGGQLQRLAIARAVLGDPAVLLLDEATSALDAESEEAVQIGLKQAMKGRTVIIIAHKLSTVQESDLIFVIEEGVISDKGTHEELINREGRYRELCSKQLIKQS